MKSNCQRGSMSARELGTGAFSPCFCLTSSAQPWSTSSYSGARKTWPSSHTWYIQNGASKDDDGEALEKVPLQKARRAMWGMSYADDAGIVSRSPDGLTRMTAMVVVACQEFALTVSESKTESMRLWSVASSTVTTSGGHASENLGPNCTICPAANYL